VTLALGTDEKLRLLMQTEGRQLLDALRDWTRSECGATEAEIVIARLAAYDDAVLRLGLGECENCGILDKPLTDGFCEGCTCSSCGAHGTMDEMGMCSRVLDSYAACPRTYFS
jgi:hypothetical protein